MRDAAMLVEPDGSEGNSTSLLKSSAFIASQKITMAAINNIFLFFERIIDIMNFGFWFWAHRRAPRQERLAKTENQIEDGTPLIKPVIIRVNLWFASWFLVPGIWSWAHRCEPLQNRLPKTESQIPSGTAPKKTACCSATPITSYRGHPCIDSLLCDVVPSDPVLAGGQASC